MALHRRSAEALELLERIDDGHHDPCTTPLNACELLQGAYLARNQEKAIQECEAILGRLEMLTYLPAVADGFGRITTSLRRSGTPVGEVDALIASYALAHGEAVVTRNVREFRRIPGLRVVTW